MAAHDDAVKALQDQIKKSVEALKTSMTKIRTGRANAAMLDGVRVDYYGTQTPLAQMAAVAVPEPRLITVKPWDKGVLKSIEKALL
ncbi:MAG TPA: ribosome recycling factor, partial [Archangium sp.]